MTIELKMLAYAVVLGFVQISAQATASIVQRGLPWAASARDGEAPPLSPVAARLERALRNLLETFAFFAAAVLAVVVSHRTSSTTALGAELYLGARVVYLGLYAAGVPHLRTLIWSVSMVGIAMVLAGLF